MRKIAFFDTKNYDISTFGKYSDKYDISFFEDRLSIDTVERTKGFDAVVVFVNDKLTKEVIDKLVSFNVKMIALRCAGFNNVDIKSAHHRIRIARVPAYSPYAVAEHATALLLSLNRKIHKAYARTREFNFSLNGLTGFDMNGKTVGIIGTGRIGQIFTKIARGFGMNVLGYDLYPNPNADIDYVSLDELLKQSDIISIHIPLNDSTRKLINDNTISKMKDGVILLNTSRGEIIETNALVKALKSGKIRGAGLDVYEEEANVFFEDKSQTIIDDDTLRILLSFPNVILTSHQAFLTHEALSNIALVTIQNLDEFFNNLPLTNEICLTCKN